MATVTTLRRAAGASPPLSGGRTVLASALAAQAAATERAGLLETALTRARDEAATAEVALAAAKERVKVAAERGYEHVVNRIVGRPAPSVPSRFHAAAALAEAEAAAEDAIAASRAISEELEALRRGDDARARAIAGAVDAVLADEMADRAAALIAEIGALHRQLVDRGRALYWLWRHHVVAMDGANATPGAAAARSACEQPIVNSMLWNTGAHSRTETQMEQTLAALQRDASAPLL